ncbi:response regulator transcription factor [Novosphingobium mangrovi (ex Huang et al. 2023)]|uniref:Response regulator transcription factor n=1 Tax=Novosphingobium mangrovi (ex Huang et al. 2023) TaxID=2976432 RepID=A0ABT2I9J1_9SPHN|nr:response regulator transcription factor [Novosphingobium mangrovi (ex Huang et al. 2023)]MCT2401478.1 response regulator transcription factor [Novosphingobium mangrovi (ex Huang et al. 2023)]
MTPPPTILLVEDDGALRTLTARALRQSGFNVLTAATGAEMWITLRETTVQLVVLDIMLPGTSGFDLFRRLRRESDVPIIFVSARGSEEDRVLGLELGADDYLAKPFSTRELAARVSAVLRRGGGYGYENVSDGAADGRAPDVIRFDGWQVSLARRELRSPSGAIVDLTGAEFDLLSTFLGYPQRVLGRERLMELSRSRVGDSSDRSIDVLVSRLRRKLQAEGSPSPIVTVRGVGYMFKAEVARA